MAHDTEDSQDSIEQGARAILQGYPLAAGLTPINDVVNSLDALRSLPLSLYPPVGTASVNTGPHEPLFAQYAEELEALTSTDSSRHHQWRQNQVQRAAEAVRGHVAAADNGFPSIDLPAPAFPIPDLDERSAPPPMSNTVGGSFLSALELPYVQPRRTIPNGVQPLLSQDFADHDARAFFDSFLNEQRVERAELQAAYGRPTTPPQVLQTTGEPLQPYAAPTSSPDPLSLSTNGDHASRTPREVLPQAHRGQRIVIAMVNGQRYDSRHIESSPGAASSSARSSSPSFSATSTPRHDNRSTSNVDPTNAHDASASTWQTPGAGTAKVESAVKKIRLTNGTTSKSTVKANEVTDFVETLSDLLSDLFAADDSFVMDTSEAHLDSHAPAASSASNFFHATKGTSDATPLLKSDCLRQLLKLLLIVQSRKKGAQMLQEIGDENLARLLKILERSWRDIDELDPWPAAAPGPRGLQEVSPAKDKDTPASKAKSKSPTKRRGSSKPEDEDEDFDMASPSLSQGLSIDHGSQTRSRSRSRSPAPSTSYAEHAESSIWTTAAMLEFDRSSTSLSDGVLAARVALAVLTVTSLPKVLYSADYIISIVKLLRSGLDSLVLPLLSCAPNSNLAELRAAREHAIVDVAESIAAALQLATRLVQLEELSEEIVMTMIFLAISSVFCDPATATVKGKKADLGTIGRAARSLRTGASLLVRALFARYPGQRELIVEEAMNNVTRTDLSQKGRSVTRLRTGTTIQAVSALLLQLVQTMPSGLLSEAMLRIEEARGKHLGLVPDESCMSLEDADNAATPTRSSIELAIRHVSKELLQPAAESSAKTAWMITSTLLYKSCKGGKASAGSAASEYRAVLDNLLSDLLSTLYLPEWPASEVLLGVFCRSIITALSDAKTSAEANALKTLALDHIGAIAAHLCHDLSRVSALPSIKTVREIRSESDLGSLADRVSAQIAVISSLAQQDDAPVDFAMLKAGLDVCTSAMSMFDLCHSDTSSELGGEAPFPSDALQVKVVDLFISCFHAAQEHNVFGVKSEDGSQSSDRFVLQIARDSVLFDLYQTLLDRILDASESSAVGFRTKALRAISLVVAQDPNLFSQAEVHRCIASRMHDSSPAVRDSAIELVGKYVVTRPNIAAQYLPQIGERITDTGLGVRKRVVKLLKALFPIAQDHDARVEICRKLVWRALDEDENIRDLAVDSVEDLWLSSSASSADLKDLSRIILAIAGDTQDRPPPVDEILRLINTKYQAKGTSPPLHRLHNVVGTLINSLVENDSSPDAIACIKTIYVLSAAQPVLLSIADAQLLLPWLLGASSPQEQMICDYLLKIFRSVVSQPTKSTSTFGKELQNALMPILNKPPSNIMILQEVVACYCAVIRYQTKDFASIVSVFRASTTRLANEVKKLADETTRESVNVRALPMLCFLSALLCEHGEIDQCRQKPALKIVIDSITTGAVSDYVYKLLIRIHSLPTTQGVYNAAMTSLGFMFRAVPRLMLQPSSTTLMDAAFLSGPPHTRLQLLRIIQDFLSSQNRAEGDSGAMRSQNLKIEELVGNVDGFADSGVASAIAQRYIQQILEACLSAPSPLHRVAVDILTSIARSGFSHPLTIAPVLVALTSSSDPQISTKVYATLSLIHSKHATLLATRFAEPVKASYTYAKAVSGANAARGFLCDPPDSCLGRWYSLVQKEKRSQQLDFLKALTRLLDVEPEADFDADQLSFVRFLAECLSALTFKRQEEPMTVIYHLNAILAVSGLHIMHLLEPQEGLLRTQEEHSNDPEDRTITPITTSLALQSVACGIVLLLRDHLKQLYSLSDHKMTKFVPGKKSAIGDRGCIVKSNAPGALCDYARMPFALQAIESEEDCIQQCNQYIAMIREDGTVGAIDELDDEKDDA